MLLYAVTIFLSAFLLFQVQPLIAKIILPWFGGTAAVWSAAMLFFQLVLLAGYAYAHLMIRYVSAKRQMMVHVSLLVASCVLLPIFPAEHWKPSVAGDPTLRILALLAATIGLPYALLSASSPLLQAWYVRRTGSKVPYRLFALSNFGSMLALVSFPFLVEPNLSSHQQANTWSLAYIAFAMVCGWAAYLSREDGRRQDRPPHEVTGDLASGAGDLVACEEERPTFGQLLLWVSLAACASTLLVSITTHLSQNVAPIPLLWVLPLALYLLTFILAFESDSLYRRWIYFPLLAAALGYMAWALHTNSGNLHIKKLIPLYAGGLFLCCMMCHGELARRRPGARHVTLFYLMVSLGGAIGGIFVAFVAPNFFRGNWELPIGLVACATLGALVLWDVDFAARARWHWIIWVLLILALGGGYAWIWRRIDTPWRLRLAAVAVAFLGLLLLWNLFLKLGRWPLRILSVAAAGLLAGYLVRQEADALKGSRLTVRNFYGVLHVKDDPPTDDDAGERTLTHGTINHGSQILPFDPNTELQYRPTAYYGEDSGVGRAIRAIQALGPARLGVVGLGAGVLSTYGRAGDYVRIYEINPLVERIAQTEFTFFPHSAADKKILMGDARLTMERQESQQFDLLAVDAFSSDAIPIHLLTREALRVYFRHLKPNGILALHISNRYLNLEPVCARGAQDFDKKAMVVADAGEGATYLSSSTWVLLTSEPGWFKTKAFRDIEVGEASAPASFRTWTDDYSNVVQILNLKD